MPLPSGIMTRARLNATISKLNSTQIRVFSSFWLLGLINNVLYVIILSAAIDLVGPSIPAGLVLLADVLPSFLVKFIAPYFIHIIPYNVRVVIFCILSAGGMLLVATTPAERDAHSISMKLLGVAIASLSSGGGELSFLGLTHYFGHLSLVGWGSGTGGAGLVGAGAYVLATSTFGLSSRMSLFAFSFLPVVMLLSFFVILPAIPSVPAHSQSSNDYEQVPSDAVDDQHDQQSLLRRDSAGESRRPDPVSQKPASVWDALKTNLGRARGLFFPYMLPLLLVYIAEYTINQGVAPTLLFPISETPFRAFRDFYPTYNAIYQLGVFISRSSTPFYRIKHLYLPSLLQCLNLVILTLQALFNFIPTIWLVFAMVFWEGLLGGAVYVNTFAKIIDDVPSEEREFSLSATTVSDSGGICIAAFVSMAFETWLCNWQVARGRDFCRRV